MKALALLIFKSGGTYMDNDKIIVERKYIIEATYVENNEYGVTLKVDIDL